MLDAREERDECAAVGLVHLRTGGRQARMVSACHTVYARLWELGARVLAMRSTIIR